MRIGIITYHRTTNFGAALQAFGLLQAVRRAGADVEIIDYRSSLMKRAKADQLRALNSSLSDRTKRLLRTPLEWRRRLAFNDFIKRNIPLSSNHFYNHEQLLEWGTSYDRVMIGSDQVWNYSINGADSGYFGAFARDKTPIVSYASSFGLEAIPDGLREWYREGLESLAAIGVREHAGAKLVASLVSTVPEVVPDPVFLLAADEWRASSAARAVSGPGRSGGVGRVVTYFLNGATRNVGQNVKKADDMLRSMREVKFAGGFSLNDLVSRSTSVNLGRDPFDFVLEIDRADYVLADSFHATAMSIILDRPFGVVLKGDPGKDARIVELLDYFSLSDRILDISSKANFDRPSDSTDLSLRLKQLRMQGLSYLDRILSVDLLRG